MSADTITEVMELPPSLVFLTTPGGHFKLWDTTKSEPPRDILPSNKAVELCTLRDLIVLSEEVVASFPYSAEHFTLRVAVSSAHL